MEDQGLSIQDTSYDPRDYVEGKGFGIRALSWIIDMVVLYIGNSVVGFIAGFVLGLTLFMVGLEFNIREDSLQCLNILAGIIQTVVYTTLFEWLYGATLGKLALGMRVVKEDGAPCDSRAAFIRAIYRYIDGLILGLPAYLSMKLPLHQRLGDKSAKTIVVGSKDPIIKESREWGMIFVAGILYLAFAGLVTILILVAVLSVEGTMDNEGFQAFIDP
ncbi:MAG: hypothetical protein GTO18_19530 [Anaerolineales bacterium]|nr:hypothetical protein [Anaerolineales bacterium]